MIKVIDIYKSFERVRAVNGVSFEVNKGEIFALLGPNGAGKSTTIRMLTGITRPDKGEIVFDPPFTGNRLRDASFLGYLPEERGLYRDVPVLDTLIYFGVLRGMSRHDAKISASNWLKRFDLDKRASDKITTLSKGNQQKVQFIATILHNPVLAVLDEPFSGFDPINQELFSGVITELRDNGTTILLSAHQLALVEKIADRILVLNKGKSSLSGTMDEIRSKANDAGKIHLRFASLINHDLARTSLSPFGDIVPGEGNQITILLKNASALNPLLDAVTQLGPLSDIQKEKTTLHEIFIDAFKENE